MSRREAVDNSEMPGSSAALRVLVIDDEPLIRWLLAQVLVDAASIIIEAGTAREAILWLDEGARPDLVFLDYRLPDSEDWQLLRTIKTIAPDSVIVLTSAHVSPDFADQARRLGAFAVLDKPFDLDDVESLVKVVQATLSRSESFGEPTGRIEGSRRPE